MHTSISLKYPVSLEKSEDIETHLLRYVDTPHLNYSTKEFYQTSIYKQQKYDCFTSKGTGSK